MLIDGGSSLVRWLVVGAALLWRPEGAGGAGGECAGVAPGCRRVREHRLLLCAGPLKEKYLSGSHKTPGLTLCRWPEASFDPAAILSRFPYLKRFALSDSNVSELVSDFPRLEFLQEVDLFGLQLATLRPSALAQLPTLRSLDLRNNSLRVLDPAALTAPPSLRQVLLAGNPWDCGDGAVDWLAGAAATAASATGAASTPDASAEGEAAAAVAAAAAARVGDAGALLCGGEDFNRRSLAAVVRYRQETEAGCPSADNCSCSLNVVPSMPGGPSYLIPVVTVDCSGRGLRALPATLPPNATILHAQFNQISDLQPLVSNAHYASVRDLYLQDNRVASVAPLEGSAWLLHFRLLDLRANRLRQLPTYALESALHRNHNASRLYLGANPWQCDCQTTPSFQEFLVKYHKLVEDEDDIRCSLDEGSGEKLLRMQDISRSSLCRDHHTYYVEPLDLLNGVLASLILLILGKLAYDYWHFKKTGKLPWIVTKMP